MQSGRTVKNRKPGDVIVGGGGSTGLRKASHWRCECEHMIGKRKPDVKISGERIFYTSAVQ